MGFWCWIRKAQYLKKKKSFYQRPPLSSIKFRGKYLSTAFWQLFAYSYPLFCQSLHIGCRNKIYRQFVFKFRTVHAYNKMKGCLRENLNLWNRLIHSQELKKKMKTTCKAQSVIFWFEIYMENINIWRITFKYQALYWSIVILRIFLDVLLKLWKLW